MPPAFNLSQDQTLQFNLCYLPSLAGSKNRRSLKILTGQLPIPEKLSYFSSVRAFDTCSCNDIAATAAPPSNAHTYRLLVVKELALLVPSKRCVQRLFLVSIRTRFGVFFFAFRDGSRTIAKRYGNAKRFFRDKKIFRKHA
jgi:hypothetical protein